MEPNLMFHTADMFSDTDSFHLSIESRRVFLWLSFLRILYAAYLNVGPESSYITLDSSWFFSVPPCKIWDILK
jgi:hypothetical protein